MVCPCLACLMCSNPSAITITGVRLWHRCSREKESAEAPELGLAGGSKPDERQSALEISDLLRLYRITLNLSVSLSNIINKEDALNKCKSLAMKA